MNQRSKTQKMIWMALLAALLAVIAPVTIPIGPIPFSMAMLGVYFIGAMLPPLQAMGALAVYVMLGLVGLPVFSGYQAGPQVLVGPTGGYLWGYFLIALAVSLAVRRGLGLPLQMAAAVAGTAACYLLGTLWFMAVSGNSFGQALLLCVAPFAIPDLIKAAVALVLARAIKKRLSTGGAAKEGADGER